MSQTTNGGNTQVLRDGSSKNPTSRPANPAASLSPVNETQVKEIAALKTAEAAVEKAKSYFTMRQTGAAAAAIDKALELKPELLTETKVDAPRTWNEFWFAYRAFVQEKKLAPNDTAGRLKVAEWLRKGGQTTLAGNLLSSILEAEKDNTQAQLLAKEWGIGEPPVRFDFAYGVNNPLLLDKWQEGGKDLMIRKDRQFLLLPFAYTVRAGKLTVAKGSLKVTGDDGKTCIAKGMITMQAQQQGQERSAASIPQVMLDQGESLWNRFTIEQKSEKLELMPSEPARPVFALPPRTPGEKRPPEPRRTPERPPTATAKPASGYAAFLVEVPSEFKYLDCEYRGTPPLRLDAGFIAALKGGKDDKGADRVKLIEQLAGFVTAKEPAIAIASIAKLSSLKGGGNMDAANSAGESNASLDLRVDKALVGALRHSDPLTRQAAFASVVQPDTAPAEVTLELFRSCPDPEAAIAAVDVLAGMLKPVMRQGQTNTFQQSTNDALGSAVAGLPPSTAGAGLYAVLAACLQHKDPKVRQRAVDAILADGTQASVTALAKAAADTRQLIIAKLATLPDGALKSAVFRVLLVRADAGTLSRLLPACPTVSLTITSDEDPLLTALGTQNSPAILQLLLDVLGRADTSAIANSEKFSRILDGVITTQQKSPEIRAAMLKLALGGFKSPYQAPVKRDRQSSGNTKGPADAGFEFILASLAATADAKTAGTALTALLTNGRLTALLERLKENTTDQQRQLLTESAVRNRPLWTREAVPCFLATRLADKDPKTQQLALMGLAAIEKSTPGKERWRFNLAVKQAPGFEWKQLMDLTASSDENVAQAATDLLLRMAMMPAADATEFKNAADRASRESKLTTLEGTRTSKPAGQYVAMVYIDLKAPDAQQQPGEAASSGPKPQPRNSIPLRAGTVTMQAAGNNIRVLLEGQDLDVGGERGGGSGGMRINAGVVIRAAFASPDAAKEGIAEKVDPVSLNEKRECELKYEALGAWSGEVNIHDSQAAADPDRPLRLVGARVVLEPLPTN